MLIAKISLHCIFKLHILPFYLTEKHQICILYHKTFIKNNCIKELCKKSFKNIEEFHIHTEKDCLCFFKNSTNQIFIFIKGKLVYFKKHLVHQVYIAPLRSEVFTTIKCSVSLPDN